jgi:hypothetical protein
MEKENFVRSYKNLYDRIQACTTQKCMVQIMCEINGGNLNPLTVFDEKTGKLFGFQELKISAISMLKRIVKESNDGFQLFDVLNMNIENWKTIKKSKNKLTANDRAIMFSKNQFDPTLYFDSQGIIQ